MMLNGAVSSASTSQDYGLIDGAAGPYGRPIAMRDENPLVTSPREPRRPVVRVSVAVNNARGQYT